LAILRAGLTARQWRVQKTDILASRGLRHFTGNLSRRRRVIDGHAAAFDSRENPFISENNGPNIIVVADTTKHDFCALRCGGGCFRTDATELGTPLLSPRGRSIEYSNFVPGFLKVTRHRITHYTEANKRNTHTKSLFR
jgi:hypothetical protein